MKYILTLLAFLMSAPAYSHEDHTTDALEFSSAWARETMGRTMSAAAYVTIKNIGSQSDTITGVSSDAAAMVQLHRSYEEDGVMRMQHTPELDIKAGETATLKPGSYHIMLMRLTSPLAVGDVFTVTVSFKHAGDIKLPVEVTTMAGK